MEDNLGVQARGDFDAVEPWCLKPRVGIRGPCSYSSTSIAVPKLGMMRCCKICSETNYGELVSNKRYFFCVSLLQMHESMNILDDDP